jgi:ectoine hydroxylase-related dioxygenase (phytanoyl-CoA dioxygenase family)
MNDCDLELPQIETHGVRQQTGVDCRLDTQVEELRCLGYTVVDSGLSASVLHTLRESMERIYQTQIDEVGLDVLRRCNDLDVARCPLAYDERFIGVAAASPLRSVLHRVLGDNVVLLQQNGLFNRPGAEHYQTHWHRDLSFQHWTSSEPIALNALLALDDFTVRNGATHVLPASHLQVGFPSEAYVRRFEVPLEVPAGSFLVLDAMLFHRAGRNLSSGQRRAVNHLIGRPFLAQQLDIPSLVDPKHAQDEFLSRYLGFRWAPCRSVADWRRLRAPSPAKEAQ